MAISKQANCIRISKYLFFADKIWRRIQPARLFTGRFSVDKTLAANPVSGAG